MTSRRALLILSLGLLFSLPIEADSGFNRCKKFSGHPAAQPYTGSIYRPVAPHGMPAPLLKILPYINDPHPDYAGYLHVIEVAQGQEGYLYWFWDLRSGRLISGPSSSQPALWRIDSRLFIAPDTKSRPSDFDQTGYSGSQDHDSARYYVWDENQHRPDHSNMILLDCGN